MIRSLMSRRRLSHRAWARVLSATVLVSGAACDSPRYPPPPETRRWIDEQNAHAELIIGNRELRDELRERLTELMDSDDVGGPRRAGEAELFTLRRRGEPIAKIVRRPAPAEDSAEAGSPIAADGEYEVVVDPLDISDDGTTSVAIRAISPDGRLLAYAIRRGGPDEVEIRIRDLETGDDLPNALPLAMRDVTSLYGSVFFLEDSSGFIYVTRSREIGPRAYLHRIRRSGPEDQDGQENERDPLLFGEDLGPRNFLSVSSNKLPDGRWVRLYSVQHGWARSDVYLQVIDGPDATEGDIVAIAEGLEGRFSARFVDGELMMQTSYHASNERVVAVDVDQPGEEHWREVIAETEDVLDDYALIGDRFYATYMHDVSTVIRVYERDGSPVEALQESSALKVPPLHSASISGAGAGHARLTLQSFARPAETYDVDLATGNRELWQAAQIADAFNGRDVEVEQVHATSKDGTRVPVFVVHRSDTELDGDNPTLLYGYGGFTAPLMPSFNAAAAVWVERGGVYAVATLRGDTEFGETWHRGGMLENKQNVFDDFIAAAEHLIAAGYTRPERLAIRSVSNGGLLVGSVLTQRPELFRAVFCGFPDLDMVRFNTFTKTNNMPALLEYGDAGIPEQFEFLRRYSPYQAVRDGVDYPAVMLTSGDLDTRVSPLQARKMTARLQAATGSGLPVILRYDPRAGHAGGRPRGKVIDDTAAELAFLMTQLGMVPEAAR